MPLKIRILRISKKSWEDIVTPPGEETFAGKLSFSSIIKSVAVRVRPPSIALILIFERIGIVFLLSTTL